jgi:hypothetical protein
VEKMLVARRVATKLFATESAVDEALAEATEMMSEMLRGRAELRIAATPSDAAVAKVAQAISALSQARTAMVDAHAELNELKLRLGIRTKMDGPEDKVEQAPEVTGLREVA